MSRKRGTSTAVEDDAIPRPVTAPERLRSEEALLLSSLRPLCQRLCVDEDLRRSVSQFVNQEGLSVLAYQGYAHITVDTTSRPNFGLCKVSIVRSMLTEFARHCVSLARELASADCKVTVCLVDGALLTNIFADKDHSTLLLSYGGQNTLSVSHVPHAWTRPFEDLPPNAAWSILVGRGPCASYGVTAGPLNGPVFFVTIKVKEFTRKRFATSYACLDAVPRSPARRINILLSMPAGNLMYILTDSMCTARSLKDRVARLMEQRGDDARKPLVLTYRGRIVHDNECVEPYCDSVLSVGYVA